MAIPEALYMKMQFDAGKSKGEEHRKKIKKILKNIYIKADFLDMCISSILFATITLFGGIILMFAEAVNLGLVIPNLEATDEVKRQFAFGDYNKAFEIAISLTIMAFLFGFIAAYKTYTKYQLQKVIKKYHIDTIK